MLHPADPIGTDDRLLLRSGHRLTEVLIEKIANLAQLNLIREVVWVSAPEQGSGDEKAD